MMRSRLVGLALSIAWALFAPGAMAQEVAAPDPFAGYVQFMSNYIGRGLAQSVGNPSVQGEFDYIFAQRLLRQSGRHQHQLD